MTSHRPEPTRFCRHAADAPLCSSCPHRPKPTPAAFTSRDAPSASVCTAPTEIDAALPSVARNPLRTSSPLRPRPLRSVRPSRGGPSELPVAPRRPLRSTLSDRGRLTLGRTRLRGSSLRFASPLQNALLHYPKVVNSLAQKQYVTWIPSPAPLDSSREGRCQAHVTSGFLPRIASTSARLAGAIPLRLPVVLQAASIRWFSDGQG